MISNSDEFHVHFNICNSRDKERFCLLLVILALCPVAMLTCVAIIDADADSFTADGIRYETISENKVQITDCDTTKTGDIFLSPSVAHDGKVYSVTSISDCAFDNCVSLTSVTIPNSVTFVSNDTFKGCKSLTAINVSDGNSKYYSVDGVLFDKGVTILVKYPAGRSGPFALPGSVSTIGDMGFYGCNSLSSVIIPDSVLSIGEYAFCRCSSLISVSIPDSVTTIGKAAFIDCVSLKSVTISENIKAISDATFSGCKSLKSVHLPDKVVSIGDFAFSGCESLEFLFIPSSVTAIGKAAFMGCSVLTNVYIIGFATVITISEDTFKDCNMLEGIHVPSMKYSDYRGAECWSSMKDLLVPAW